MVYAVNTVIVLTALDNIQQFQLAAIFRNHRARSTSGHGHYTVYNVT